MKCSHCDKLATSRRGEGDQAVYYCLDCREREARIEQQEFAQTVSLLNFALGQFDQQTGGLLGPTPRMQIPQAPLVQSGPVNVGNVHVENSNVGVINTGTINSIESAVGKLTEQGSSQVATAIGELFSAIRADQTVNAESRTAMADLLSVLAEEALKPKKERRLRAVRACFVEFAAFIGGAAGLSQLWQQHGPTIVSFFGLN